MSDSSYADAFGKWLNNPNARKIDVPKEDSNDSSDNIREYAKITDHNRESESEKLQKNLSSVRGNKLLSGSLSDQAPILVDDDDDDLFTSKKQQYEDEPPILEPVQNQLQSRKISVVQNPQFSQICVRNYSRNNRNNSKRSLKEHKMYNNKGKLNFITPDVCESSLKSKDIKSGNIFDKFNSENYDFPPPLIPSPEALQICSESPSSLAKNPSHSPNFCAMEADSTSEINRDTNGTIFIPQKLSKNSVHEISVECDSTCMLAASPIIVSPTSITNGEMEETIDSGDGGSRDEELECNGYKSKNCNALEKQTENEDQSKLLHIQKCLVDEIIHKDASDTKHLDKGSGLHIAEEQQHNSNPEILGISTLSNNNYRSLSVDVDNDAQSNVSEYSPEPPILSAISPPLIRCHTRSGKERYTVDSPKTFSKSRKRPHIKASEYNDAACAVLDGSSPPILNRVSETAMTTLRGRHSRVVSEHSQNECPNCHQDKTRSQRRQRCNSLPVSGESDYYDCLSVNLHSFIIGTSDLSDLQTHMHRLLHILFPQLKTELDTMSPESFKFESLLSDLVKFLEQPDDQDSSTASPLTICRNIKPAYIYDHPRLTSELSCTFKNISDELFSPLLSTSDSQAAADYAKIVLNSDAISCSHTSPSKLSSSYPHSYHSRQRRRVTTRQSDDKDLVAPLSRLSVSDVGDILTPSKVLLCKDPGASLEWFVKLSCRALQLLLPDLTVSVYNELGHSPHELVAFINNVILTNSRRRKKY